MIELDGSFGEGGGALVRTALALSTLTGKEFKVNNIRAGRPKPGLKAQHLNAIKALKEICSAKTNDISLGSEFLHFIPGKIKRGIFEIDIGTAGSISLLLQALILPCMFAPRKVTLKIKGGTCGKWQASVDYIRNVLFPHLLKFVEDIELKVMKRGYYPKGGGEVIVEIKPTFGIDEIAEELPLKVAKIKLNNQEELQQIRGVVNLSLELEDKEIGKRIRMAAINNLNLLQVPINIREEYTASLNVGGEIVLWAIYSTDFDNPIIIGSDALIEKGKKSEDIGKEVAKKLVKEINTGYPVDHFLADQLIPYMALLPGSQISTSEISNHAKTNMYVVEKFLPVGYKIDNNVISVEER